MFGMKKLIAQSGISMVYYAEDYEGRSSWAGKDFFKKCGIQIIMVNI
jgi:deoxycytidylate deaminase